MVRGEQPERYQVPWIQRCLIANQRRYNLEHTNNIINSSGRRVRGFVGIEALVQPDLTPNGWRA